MRVLKQNLQARRRFDPERPPYPLFDSTSFTESDWPDYIAGLLSADGSLAIQKSGQRFKPVLDITQRVDDLPLLEEIRRRTGVGGIYTTRAYGNSAPAVKWVVHSRLDLNRICEQLDQHPPRGRRGTEFVVWRRAVSAYLSPRPAAARRRELADLSAELRELRTCHPPA